MAEVKCIVCLANSRKLGGRCVAGKELTSDGSGPWVRLISARPTEELSEDETQLSDVFERASMHESRVSHARVLDVVKVPLISAKPNSYQPENWLLDPGRSWELRGHLGWEDLRALADEPSVLWDNGSSTVSGLNDRVPMSKAAHLGSSLYLLYVQDVRLNVFAPGAAFGNLKLRVQARFTYLGVSYGLRVTDPYIERWYGAGIKGQFPIGQCYVTVSLGEPWGPYCYKFAAAIITPQRGQV